ncbi:hypothetical protein Leryth_001713 [Lithospermum erythrorhizon]|nr:hypothetical protein Leryth_001713 [Lithospermum erythrorhizon]
MSEMITTTSQLHTSTSNHLNPQEGEGEEFCLVQQQNRRPNITLQFLEGLEKHYLYKNRSSLIDQARIAPRPNSAKLISSVKNLLPQKSYKAKNPSQDVEKVVFIVPEAPSSDKPSTSRSFSLNRVIFPSSTKSAAHSMPVTPVANVLNKPSEDDHKTDQSMLPRHMKRSLSVPLNVKARSLRRTDSSGRMIRVIAATPRPETTNDALQDGSSEIQIVEEDPGEDIPEEEAVCRICFIELGEGGETLKMECSCKGELALSHKECAVKWFTIKGNKTCDVCKQEVRNLPVMLFKIQNPPPIVRRPPTRQQRDATRYRVWEDVPVLVMVSVLAYFCFLEQLLVSDLGVRALALSLPFSVILGFLSAVIASTMVSKSYIWAYASFQFASVILFAHIFYAVLDVNAILTVMLSSFTGFGIAISTNSLLVEYLRWRTNQRRHSQHTISPNVNTQRQLPVSTPQLHQQNQAHQYHHHQQQHGHNHYNHNHDQQHRQQLFPVTENSSLEQIEVSRVREDSRAHNP